MPHVSTPQPTDNAKTSMPPPHLARTTQCIASLRRRVTQAATRARRLNWHANAETLEADYDQARGFLRELAFYAKRLPETADAAFAAYVADVHMEVIACTPGHASNLGQELRAACVVLFHHVKTRILHQPHDVWSTKIGHATSLQPEYGIHMISLRDSIAKEIVFAMVADCKGSDNVVYETCRSMLFLADEVEMLSLREATEADSHVFFDYLNDAAVQVSAATVANSDIASRLHEVHNALAGLSHRTNALLAPPFAMG